MPTPDGEAPHPGLRLGSRHFDLTARTLVMGILDRIRAPDRPPLRRLIDGFLAQAEEHATAGVDMLDIGGPGRGEDENEELERVMTCLEALTARFDLPTALDTASARVLDAAGASGVVLARDSTGFRDPDFLPTARRHDAAIVAIPGALARARAAGFAADQIVVDGGFALGKIPAERALLLSETGRLARLGHPLLLSIADPEPSDAEASDPEPDAALVAIAYGIAHGCRLVLVHDVAGTVRVARVLQRILEVRQTGSR